MIIRGSITTYHRLQFSALVVLAFLSRRFHRISAFQQKTCTNEENEAKLNFNAIIWTCCKATSMAKTKQGGAINIVA